MAGFTQANIDIKELAKNLGMDVPTVYDAVVKSRRGGWMRVWGFVDKGNLAEVRLTASIRKKDGSGFDETFSNGHVAFFGSAYEKVKQLTIDEHRGTGIMVLDCDAKRKWDAAKQKEYINWYVYDIDVPDKQQPVQQQQAAQQPQQRQQTVRRPALAPVDDFDDELPF